MKIAKQLLVGCLLLTVLLSACSEAEDSGWKRIESPSLHLSVSVPDDWVMSFESDVLYLSSSQEALDSKVYEEQAAVSLAITGLEELEGAAEPSEIVDNFLLRFSRTSDDLQVTSETTPGKVQGQPSASASFHGVIGEQEGDYTLTAIVHDQQAIIIFTIDGSAEGSFAKILAQITSSVSFE
ncbi:MAG: hypothetical protein JW726_06095 [Anaerolineales bacterium]|nr:hypothetical protein [Anaerolineales bacterium]